MWPFSIFSDSKFERDVRKLTTEDKLIMALASLETKWQKEASGPEIRTEAQRMFPANNWWQRHFNPFRRPFHRLNHLEQVWEISGRWTNCSLDGKTMRVRLYSVSHMPTK